MAATPPPDPNALYPGAPPPPPANYGGPAGYPSWPPNAPPYRGPMLPGWLTFGGILVLVGGILILVGFIVDLVGTASYFNGGATANLSAYAAAIETYDALVGVGIFLAALGWLFHQMAQHRHAMGR